MGKYSLLVTLGLMTGITLITAQGFVTNQDTRERQSQREGEVIARQIARTGYNAVLAKARQETEPGKDVDEIISDVGVLQGSYEGGTYRARLEKISPTAYKAVSDGKIVVADELVKHEMGDDYAGNTMQPPLITEQVKLKAEFEQSQAGYCSAIYLQRIQPDTDPEDQPEPEMVFDSGHYRNEGDASTAVFEKTLQPGTRLNFILAVDKNCSLEGESDVEVDNDGFAYTRPSFSQGESELGKMEEAPYGMIEEMDDGWRVAFEDLVFDEAKLWDIKENGYPNSDPGNSDWDPNEETYGGDGWPKNDQDLRDVIDYSGAPDFSDQVFHVEMKSPSEFGDESDNTAE